jgi:hypothetical protein
LREAAVIDFIFPFKRELDQRVHIFLIYEWIGHPKKTEEMEPFWFDITKVPYDKMWDSDKLWMPSLLEGKSFYARFVWKEDNETVAEYSIDFMDELKY